MDFHILLKFIAGSIIGGFFGYFIALLIWGSWKKKEPEAPVYEPDLPDVPGLLQAFQSYGSKLLEHECYLELAEVKKIVASLEKNIVEDAVNSFLFAKFVRHSIYTDDYGNPGAHSETKYVILGKK